MMENIFLVSTTHLKDFFQFSKISLVPKEIVSPWESMEFWDFFKEDAILFQLPLV